MTEGKPKVVSIVVSKGFQEDDLLRLAASAERSSEHPLADAIVRAANERGLSLSDVREFDSPTGKGVTGKVDGKAVLLGNAGFLRSSGVETRDLEPQAEKLRGDGATVINIAVNGELAGLFAIADPVKQSTPDALKALRAEGIKIVMLTGDNRTTAGAIAQRLGLADVGIAMGTGTDVAMESAGVTLLKGDLNGIVRARRRRR